MFEHTIKVHGFHLDLYQHVNNARYLEFLEDARWAMFEQCALVPLMVERALGAHIVHMDLSFKAPATLYDTLKITSYVSRIGNKSYVIRQEIVNQKTDTLVLEANITSCIVDNNTKKSIVIEGEVLEGIKFFQQDQVSTS